ncbi:MAG TPA: HAD-IIIA family hydrolase [Armatimonadota bacterium]|jgi:D-glycero-D-manno-heptose 1,7-bisphosphate phosphatase
MPKAAIFLDRDGVLNSETRGAFVRTPEEFQWLPGAREGVAELCQAGWPVVLITNQSGIGRGLYTPDDLNAIHAKMEGDLAAYGAKLAAIYACPHVDSDACLCRKPLPGMLYQAAADLDLDLPRSTFVGDAQRDAQAGRAAGCRVVAVTSGLQSADDVAAWETAPDAVFPTLQEAAAWLNAERASHE